MLIMLHHDCAYNPTAAQLGITPGKKNQPSQKSVVNQAAHIAFLEQHPLEKVSEADLDLVSLYHLKNAFLFARATVTLFKFIFIRNWKCIICFSL